MKYIIILLGLFFIFGISSCQNIVTKEYRNHVVEIYFIPYSANMFIEMSKQDLLKFDLTRKCKISDNDTINLLIEELNNTMALGEINESKPDIRVVCLIKLSTNEIFEFCIDHQRYIFVGGRKYQRNAKIIEILGLYTGEF